MIIQWKDKAGYPIEKYIGNPIKSLFRLICQFIRGNARLTVWFEKKELTIKDCKCKFKRNGKFKPCEFHKQCIGNESCAPGISVCDNLIHMKQNDFDEKGNYIK